MNDNNEVKRWTAKRKAVLVNQKKIRILAVIDVFTKQVVALPVGERLRSEDVVKALSQATQKFGSPKRIFCDNGSEFAGRLTDMWAYHNKVTLAFSRPGTPTDNAFVESFNGRLRDECLNSHWFESIADARLKLRAWSEDYNASRPHKALNGLSPNEFAASWKKDRQISL